MKFKLLGAFIRRKNRVVGNFGYKNKYVFSGLPRNHKRNIKRWK